MLALVVSPASLVPSSSRSAHASTELEPATLFENAKETCPDASLVPDPVDADGDPPPETVNATGMNCSGSPCAPVTVAVNVADCPHGLVAGPLIVTVVG